MHPLDRRLAPMAPEPDAAAVRRRTFLKVGAAAGAALVVEFRFLPRGVQAASDDFAPNAFLRVAPDNTVTVVAKHLEMGQGCHTGLATIVAEELDADWAQVRVEAAPSDPARYNNLFWGPVQGTGGSSAMANSWAQLRQAGATARAMLRAAAAQKWGVAAESLTVDKGVVSHAASGRKATFGELATAAAALAMPSEVPFKDPKDWKLIGKESPRVDSVAKTNGSARFTLDVYLPDMLTAVIARPPLFGATVKKIDKSAALKVPGVTDVVEVPAGVAVLAKGFWAARKGRAALLVEWDEAKAEQRGSAELLAEFRGLTQKPGLKARADGDVAAGLASATRTFEATYEFPYLAHAPMEPLDCVVKLSGDKCEVWAGSQIPTIDQGTIAHVLGIGPEKVELHTLLAGGSFGRRATPMADVASEAASVVKAIAGRAPVKLVWTREDDIRGGRYRPLFVHRFRGGLDAKGRIVAWEHRIVGQSFMKGTPFEGLIKDGIDATSVEGGSTLPYAIPNLGVELHSPEVGVPTLWWRSVGSSHTAFSTETFLDELAEAAGRDPFELRRELLEKHPRHRGVLELAATKAGWGSPMPAGRARGIAVHESFGSFVANVVEVTLRKNGLPKVERVVCAVDCGIAINPDVVRAQMEGGIGFGLGAALYGEITLDKGRVVQSNFHDYRSLRIDDMPTVEVHIVPSSEAPTGVGEPGVPCIAPAVANAMFRLTGKRVYRLPFASQEARA
ncbi:MAG TPA: xanthine dehydrogenase family protein molybdopterin-binding subunit [Vicinamibacteria bacterium]